jgi:serine/threonine protein kinase
MRTVKNIINNLGMYLILSAIFGFLAEAAESAMLSAATTSNLIGNLILFLMFVIMSLTFLYAALKNGGLGNRLLGRQDLGYWASNTATIGYTLFLISLFLAFFIALSNPYPYSNPYLSYYPILVYLPLISVVAFLISFILSGVGFILYSSKSKQWLFLVGGILLLITAMIYGLSTIGGATRELLFSTSNLLYVLYIITGIIFIVSASVHLKHSTPVSVQYPAYQPARPYQYPTLQQQQTSTLAPSLSNWDPKLWVGKQLGVYRILSVIGEGGTSYVLKGYYDNRPYAIKVLKLANVRRGTTIIKDYYSSMQKEASNLVSLSDSPYTVKIYAVNVDENAIKSIINNNNTGIYLTDPPRIIMDFMEGGSVYELFKNSPLRYSLQWNKIVYKIIYYTSKALEYMHSQGYAHLDIKPQNIYLLRPLDTNNPLLSLTDNVKLGDLGSAVKIGGSISQLTLEYAPPEQLENVIIGKGASPSMDVFALGMTMYVLLKGSIDRPDLDAMNYAFDYYSNGNTQYALQWLNYAKEQLKNWNFTLGIEPEIEELLKKMLSPNPTERPTANEVANILSKYI